MPLAKIESKQNQNENSNESIYSQNPQLSNQSFRRQFNQIKKGKSIIVARNPLTRLYAAWKDKFRFQQQNANTSDSRYKPYTQIYFKKFRKYLSKYLSNDNEHVTFEAFARMVIDVTDDSKHNIHWRPIYDICRACQLKYDFILHLEDHPNTINSVLIHLNLTNIDFPDKNLYYKVQNWCCGPQLVGGSG